MKFPLRIGFYDLRFRALEEVLLPAFSASLWRSVLGLHLKRISEGRASAPRNLPLAREQLYEYFMETPPAPNARLMRRYTNAPHPYMLACPFSRREIRVSADTTLSLPLVLFGRANTLLDCLLLAFARAGDQGLGRQRARLRLSRVTQRPSPDTGEREIFRSGARLLPLPAWEPEAPEPPSCSIVRLRFTTPLRLAVNGRPLRPGRFNSPYPLLMNLVRRSSLLCAFHGERELAADYRTLKHQAEKALLLDKRLRWFDQQRFSARTRRAVPMGGLLGEVTLDLSQAPALWPFLWLGQWLHAGKGTVFGMGGYRLEHPS